MFGMRPWIRRLALCLAAVTSLMVLYLKTRDSRIFYHSGPISPYVRFGRSNVTTHVNGGSHPIDSLIREARSRFDQVLEKQSTTLEQAAARYRHRRGRHPPPGFDHWFAAAARSNAIIVEDFFDRIHHDINPLWALDPRDMRIKTHNQPFLVRVRNGKVKPHTISKDTPYRVEQWVKLVKEMKGHIPDLDMFVNVMDESRTLVPWEMVDKYVTEELKHRKIIDIDQATSKYSGLGDAESFTAVYDPKWIDGPTGKYWDHFRMACPPDSPGRKVSSLPSFDVPIEFPSDPNSLYTHMGYIQNFTASQDACFQPYLRGMHGTFIDSISMSTTHELLPMFAESKLPRNNELLIPSAVYLDDSWGKYSGGNVRGGKWLAKKDALVWRGSASGARNKKDNWWHVHRNRFMQMLNSTTVSALEDGDYKQAPTFRIPTAPEYPILAQQKGKLGEWVSSFADVGYTDVLCDPGETYPHWWYGEQHKLSCSWLEPWFRVTAPVSMKQQYSYKYLPDVDGNSFSGRYKAFMFSTSLPLKSTIYAEWHDDRLFPWVHFVPFDSSFMDIYGVMDYFLDGHDAEAETMAMEGKQWAEKVLRREDMKLYVWRLLLEYARVVDDDREHLAFVDDLKEASNP